MSRDNLKEASILCGGIREKLAEGWSWDRIMNFTAGMLDSQGERESEGGAHWVSLKSWERIVQATTGGDPYFTSSREVAEFLERASPTSLLDSFKEQDGQGS